MTIQLRSLEDSRPRLRRLAKAELGSWRKSLAGRELNFLKHSRYRPSSRFHILTLYNTHLSSTHIKQWLSLPVVVPLEVEVRQFLPR
jgi:hypothetical protein